MAKAQIALIALIAALLAFSGCSSINLAHTIAGGECGTVDYRITVFGTPLLGIQAERECIDRPELVESDVKVDAGRQ